MSTRPLIQTLPLHGSRLIEASAGTGKTFTIALLYVRLILNGARTDVEDVAAPLRSLLPPQILVTTFTNAAAEELKDRIRTRLVEAARAFREEHPRDNLLAALREDYPADRWPRCARLLELAAEWMDQAAISTIHSWVQRVLRSHAFDSSNLFDPTLITDKQAYRETAAQDYWRRHFYPLSTEQASVVRALFPSPVALQQALGDLLRRPEAPVTWAGERVQGDVLPTPLLQQVADDSAAAQEAQATARGCFQAHADEILQALIDKRDQFNGTSYRGIKDDATFDGWLTDLRRWAQGDDGVDDKFIRKLGRSRQKLKKNAEPADHLFFDHLDSWLDAKARAESTLPPLRARLLAHARDWVLRHEARSLQTEAELGFDELLTHLDAALQGPRGKHLAAALRGQFPVALIDEFQDTDPIQYRIFDYIYDVAGAHDDRALILIGDPKQAIYSFRGADIYTYLAARRATTDRHYHLARNFRSSSAMVTAVNQLFSAAEQHPQGAFMLRPADAPDSPLPFLPVDAQGREERLVLAGKATAGLTAWWHPELLNFNPYRDLCAEHAAEQISQWLNASDSGFQRDQDHWEALRPRDIAILVRSGKEATFVRRALQARGLASVYLSDRDSVFDSIEAQDVLRWLQACANPEDDAAVRLAIATRSLNRSLQELDALREDELEWEAHQERFLQYRHHWRRDGALPMLRRLLHDYRVAKHLQGQSGGDRTLTNLLHLAEWAQQASATLDGEHALIRALEQHIAEPNGEEDVVRLESEADLIKVVTIHKSKGLEYPLVVVPFAATWLDGGNRKQTAVWHSDDGLAIETAPKSEQGAALAYAREDEERLREDLRLLYVALTRARHACFLGVAPIKQHAKAQAPDNHRAALGYLLKGGERFSSEEDLREHLHRLASAGDAISIEPFVASGACTRARVHERSGPLVPARTPGHAAFEPWWIASYSALQTRAMEDVAGQAVSVQATPLQVPPMQAAPMQAAPETATDATRAEEAIGSEDEEVAEWLPALPTTAQEAPAHHGLHSFPRGPGPGTFLHGLLEWAGEIHFAGAAADPERLLALVAQRCSARNWEAYTDSTATWLLDFLQTPLPAGAGAGFTLSELEQYKVEAPFHFATRNADAQRIGTLVAEWVEPGRPRPALAPFQLNGLIKGFIDLVAEHDGRYYVIDWKSNYLGPNDQAYHQDALIDALLEKRYDVQCALYLLALHRHLQQRLPGYDYDTHVGGGLFAFLRGSAAPGRGVWHHRPDRAFIEALDAAFGASPQLQEAG